jgi:hypothetical protein
MRQVQQSRTSALWCAAAALLLGLIGLASRAHAYNQSWDTWNVEHGDYIKVPGIPPCGDNDPQQLLRPQVAAAAQNIFNALNKGAKIPYGSAFVVSQAVWQALGGQMRGTGAELLDRLFGSTRFASCVVVAVVIPANAFIWHINYFATNGEDWQSPPGNSMGCSAWYPAKDGTYQANSFDCAVSFAIFDPPVIETRGNVRVIASVFRNWSNDKSRIATMDVLWDWQPEH